jgi:hypothetical protein
VKHCTNSDCESLVRNGVIAEFLDDVDVCPDCGMPLTHGEAPRPEPPAYQELETIYQAADGIQAHLVKAALEEEGIPVNISGEALMGAVGELPATLLQVEVQVPPEFATRAREIALACEAHHAGKEAQP